MYLQCSVCRVFSIESSVFNGSRPGSKIASIAGYFRLPLPQCPSPSKKEETGGRRGRPATDIYTLKKSCLIDYRCFPCAPNSAPAPSGAPADCSVRQLDAAATERVPQEGLLQPAVQKTWGQRRHAGRAHSPGDSDYRGSGSANGAAIGRPRSRYSRYSLE